MHTLANSFNTFFSVDVVQFVIVQDGDMLLVSGLTLSEQQQTLVSNYPTQCKKCVLCNTITIQVRFFCVIDIFCRKRSLSINLTGKFKYNLFFRVIIAPTAMREFTVAAA